MVVTIRHENLVLAADGDSVGQPKLTRVLAGASKPQKQPTLAIEDLDIVEISVDHVSMAERVDSHSLRPTEMPGAVSHASDLPFEFAFRSEDLHATIHGIGDIQPT